MNLRQYPFLKFLIPLILCIIFTSNYYENLSFFHIRIITTIVILLSLTLWFLNSKLNYKLRWIWGVILLIIIFFSASLLTYSHRQMEYKNTLINANDKPHYYKILIIEPIEIKEKSVKIIAKVQSFKNVQNWQKTYGNVLIYFEKDSLSEKIKYGDEIVIYTDFQEIKAPQNPFQFNYKKYLSNKKIFYQSYIKSEKWTKIASGKGNIIKSFAVELRQILLDILDKNNIKGQEYAVISAVLLGQTDKIDPELYRTYINSGAVHVLAVSGMHVGIIFLTLNTLLSFIDKIKRGRIIKGIILITVIWFYAMLTGLSPSVVRASSMITLIVIGKSLSRSFNIYNIICASAFILLLFNPLLLYEIGFQLSFLAVAGIVIFHNKLYKIWTPKNIVVDKLWSVTCVSIAAQLTTGPISSFYFNQFPNYFLISNILVFLFSSLIIYTGILVLIFSFLTIISNLFALALVFLIKHFNYGLSFVENIPYSVSTGINISIIEVIGIYLLIITLFLYFQKKYMLNLKYAFTSLIFLQIFDISKAISYNNNNKIIIYSIPNNQNIEFINGRESLILSNTIIDEKTYNFNIKNNHIKSGILKSKNEIFSDSVSLINSNIFIQNKHIIFGNKRIAIVDNQDFFRKISLNNKNHKLDIDLLIISRNSVFSIEKILKLYNPKKIIIDSSNKQWLASKLSRECEFFKVPYHNILQSGSYFINLT